MYKVSKVLGIAIVCILSLQVTAMQSGLFKRTAFLLDWKLSQAPHRVLGIEKNISEQEVAQVAQDFYQRVGCFSIKDQEERKEAFSFFKRFYDQKTLKYDQFLEAEKRGTTSSEIFWQRLKRVCKGVVLLGGGCTGYKYWHKPAGPSEYQDMHHVVGMSDYADLFEGFSFKDLQSKFNMIKERKRHALHTLSSDRAYEVFKHAVLVNDVLVAKDLAASGKISADQMKGYLQELIDQKDWKVVKCYLQLFPIEEFSFNVSLEHFE